jgi:hypothetical protein
MDILAKIQEQKEVLTNGQHWVNLKDKKRVRYQELCSLQRAALAKQPTKEGSKYRDLDNR